MSKNMMIFTTNTDFDPISANVFNNNVNDWRYIHNVHRACLEQTDCGKISPKITMEIVETRNPIKPSVGRLKQEAVLGLWFTVLTL